MYKYSLKTILKTKGEKLTSLSTEKAFALLVSASEYATERIKEFMKWKKDKKILTDAQAYRQLTDKQRLKIYKVDYEKINNLTGAKKRSYIISRLAKTRDFLETKTSTVKGWEETINKFTQTLIDKGAIELKKGESLFTKNTQFKKMFEVYNLIRERDIIWRNLDSNQALAKIAVELKNYKRLFDLSPETIVNTLLGKAEKVYEKNIENEEDEVDVSDIYSIRGKI